MNHAKIPWVFSLLCLLCLLCCADPEKQASSEKKNATMGTDTVEAKPKGVYYGVARAVYAMVRSPGTFNDYVKRHADEFDKRFYSCLESHHARVQNAYLPLKRKCDQIFYGDDRKGCYDDKGATQLEQQAGYLLMLADATKKGALGRLHFMELQNNIDALEGMGIDWKSMVDSNITKAEYPCE